MYIAFRSLSGGSPLFWLLGTNSMARHSINCIKCQSLITLAGLDYLPAPYNAPQIFCPICGTGHYLSLKFRMIGVFFVLPIFISCAILTGYCIKHGYILLPEFISRLNAIYVLSALNIMLGYFSWIALVRRFGEWRIWHPNVKYYLF